MKSDPNALKHADAGFYASMTVLVALPIIGLLNTAIAALVAPFIIGVSIEIIQRIQRYISDGKQNTFKENVLDTIQTGLWYVTFYVNKSG